MVLGLMAFVAFSTMALDCEPSGQPYSLRVSHGLGDPWKTFTYAQWLNIHEAFLCDDPGQQLCTNNPPVCASNWDDQYQVNVHPGWEILDREWRRDRVAFFASGPGFRTNPFFAPENPPFVSGGPWRFWEGEGESTRLDPIPGGPVGLVRRYQRGRCSYMIKDVAELLRTTVESNLRSSFECARNPTYGCERVLRSAIPEVSIAWQYIGTDDCMDISGSNRDYYHLAYVFELIPRRRNYSSSKIGVRIDLWFQLGARRRSAFLDCPTSRTCDRDACFTEKGCLKEEWFPILYECNLPWSGCEPCFIPDPSCGDCTRRCTTRSCKQDSDCCGLPGVVCRTTDAGGQDVHGVECNERRGVCEKRAFLDVLDYGLDYRVWRKGNCSLWLDGRCYAIAQELKSTLSGLKSTAYQDIYAPLIQATYDMTWQVVPEGLGDCETTDDICHRSPLFGSDKNFDSFCNASKLCEIRPMYFYEHRFSRRANRHANIRAARITGT